MKYISLVKYLGNYLYIFMWNYIVTLTSFVYVYSEILLFIEGDE